MTAAEPGPSLAVRFHARDLHLVLAPADRDVPVRFRVTLDGRAPADRHGGDIEAGGAGVLSEPRMYQLLRQQQAVTDRTAEITFLDPGVEAYVITFG